MSSDADTDTLTLTYDWYVDGAVVQSGTTGTLAPGPFINGSVVRVVVTADDGQDTSTPTSSGAITIGNAVADDEARRFVRALGHGQEAAHAQCLDLLAIEHLDLQAMLLAEAPGLHGGAGFVQAVMDLKVRASLSS